MVTTFAAVVLWTAALFRGWRSFQNPHSRSLRAIAVALTGIAISATVNVALVAREVDAWTGWPNVGELVKELGIVLSACATLVMFWHLTRGPSTEEGESWRRVTQVCWGVASMVGCVALILFVAGGRTAEANGINFNLINASRPWIAESSLLVTAYAVVILALVAWLCARQATTSPLGRGITVLAAACVVLVLYGVARMVYIGGHRYGLDVPLNVYTAGTYLSELGLPLLALGSLVAPGELYVRSRRELRRMARLWEWVTSKQPGSVTHEPRWRELSHVVEHKATQIQDALYLTALSRGLGSGSPTPTDARVRARGVVSWLLGDDSTCDAVSLKWLSAPPEITSKEWVLLLAEEFKRGCLIPHPQESRR